MCGLFDRLGDFLDDLGQETCTELPLCDGWCGDSLDFCDDGLTMVFTLLQEPVIVFISLVPCFRDDLFAVLVDLPNELLHILEVSGGSENSLCCVVGGCWWFGKIRDVDIGNVKFLGLSPGLWGF